MEILKEYWKEALEQAAVRQLSDEYKEKGYKTLDNYSLMNLFVVKDNEKLAFVVKSGNISKEYASEFAHLNKTCKDEGIKLHYVMINDPRTKSIELKGVDKALFDYFTSNLPSALDELSSSTKLKDVSNVEINKCELKSNESINIIGNGDIEVSLFDKDEDVSFDESFAFTFDADIAFNGKCEIKSLNKIDIDTSSYYN